MTRFRHHSALAVAFVIAALGATTLAAAGAAYMIVPALLLLVAYGVWRSGTDADDNGVRVRAMVSSREIAWPHIATLRTDTRGQVFATLTNGNAVRLTAVHAADLPKLVAASGQQLQIQSP